MSARNLLILIGLLFNLVIVPLRFHDQPFDGVDNVLRAAGISEPVSREIVGGLYDLTR